MSDGASYGIKAERALETILGGASPPDEDEAMSVEEQRAYLLTAARWDDPAAMSSYDECCRCVGGEILRWAYVNIQRYAATSMDNLYDVLKAEGIDLSVLQLTGFQWGWAYNAARRCLELPPEDNPAILTIG